MKFHGTPLAGAHLLEPEFRGDERGFFSRAFCQREFEAMGLNGRPVQCNNAFSTRKGTLRGLHFQLPPAAEVKVMRCIRGAMWDVIVDMRPTSPTYRKWYGAELTADNRLVMYVPEGFAHGMITLTDDVETMYWVSSFYEPSAERGLRWNDPAIGIQWPIEPTEVSVKDANWPDFDPTYHAVDALAPFYSAAIAKAG